MLHISGTVEPASKPVMPVSPRNESTDVASTSLSTTSRRSPVGPTPVLSVTTTTARSPASLVRRLPQRHDGKDMQNTDTRPAAASASVRYVALGTTPVTGSNAPVAGHVEQNYGDVKEISAAVPEA